MAIPVMSRLKLRIGLTASGGGMVASAMLSLRKNKQINFYISAFNSINCSAETTEPLFRYATLPSKE